MFNKENLMLLLSYAIYFTCVYVKSNFVSHSLYSHSLYY